jgi:hypothetical protein
MHNPAFIDSALPWMATLPPKPFKLQNVPSYELLSLKITIIALPSFVSLCCKQRWAQPNNYLLTIGPGNLVEVQHQFGSPTLFAVTWAYSKLFSHANNERNNSNGQRKRAKTRPTATAQQDMPQRGHM